MFVFDAGRRLLLSVVAGCLMVMAGTLGVTAARADFGFLPGAAGFDVAVSNEDGSPDTAAGSHPYQVTTTLNISKEGGLPSGSPRDVYVDLPAGLIGDPSAVPRCTTEQLEAGPSETCPADTAIGFVRLHLSPRTVLSFPVYNMVAPGNTPVELGFRALGTVSVVLGASVRTGGDYGVTVGSSEISQALSVTGIELTVWGVPADPSHDIRRCTEGASFGSEPEELFEGPCASNVAPKPFLTLPSSCSPLVSSVRADSWQNPGAFVSRSVTQHDGAGNPVALEGCESLAFNPSLSIQPDVSSTGSPSGLEADLHAPLEGKDGLGEAAMKKTSVAFPAGMTLNPSAANGLSACTPEQIGLNDESVPSCPNASKIGSVEVDSAALTDPLEGSLYLAQQGNNPFGSLLAVYLVAEGDGILVKQAGRVDLDPQTGQVTATFDNIPQQPITDVKLRFFGSGSSRAPFVTPSSCGVFTSSVALSSWAGAPALLSSPSFAITSGAGGAPCPAGQPFAPGMVAGTVSNQAGAFSAFSTRFSRGDQEQTLSGVTVKTPPGLLAVLKGVERCPEPQASQGACGANSLIGHTNVSAGVGSEPVWVQGGQVFLTGPYKGAPFGLSIVVPAKAGPFDLGTVVVRAAINVDPHTAQIAITSDPLPTILQGVPLQIRSVNVTVDRPNFMFNPTNCEPLAVTGSVTSTQGTVAGVSSRFQAANCATLAFHPSFKATTQAKTSKKQGASLDVKVTPIAGQANIGKTVVVLPKQLPARLTTIQQACPEAVFAVNPASCPTGSNIGTGTATTPILGSPVMGPAYLVSHGGAAFPDVVVILQGEGVTLDLVGAVNIKGAVTTTSFTAIPDAPISSFELKLPEGPHSGLAAVVPAKAKGSLCGQSLVMPTTITGQNGAVVKQNTKIAVTGCTKAKKKSKAKGKKHPRAGGKKGKK